MRVTTRIVLLPVVVTVAFAAVLLLLSRSAERRVRAMSDDVYRERAIALDGVLRLSGSTLAGFVYDYTYWDDMVAFVARPDSGWAAENISASAPTFGAAAVWVCAPSGRLIYSYHAEDSGPVEKLPVSDSLRPALLVRERFCHFFAPSAAGLLEVWGATVHPTEDKERRTAPRGELYAARVWDSVYLAELGGLTRSALVLTDPLSPEPESAPAPGAVCVTRALPGWDGRPIACLHAHSRSPTLAEVVSSAGRDLMTGLAFAVTVSVLLAVSLFLWVRRPLLAISDSLTKGRAGPLVRLTRSKSEFGGIARLVGSFFEQRAELEEHRRHLADLVEERTRQLARAHEELVRRERLAALGQVAGSVAHELRNPLGAIRNSAYFLKLTIADKLTGKPAHHLEMIESEIERSNRVISDLLDFARGRPCQPEPCRLAEIVAEALTRANVPQDVEVIRQIAEDLPDVMVDRTQMVEAFRNLFVNACQAMPSGGKLTVSGFCRSAVAEKDSQKGHEDTENGAGGERGPCVVVEVRDTGSGIAAEHIGRIFEPLFSTKQFGVGLGLPIVRSFVEASGGKVSVHSVPGDGATFVIELPTVVSHKHAPGLV